MTTANISMLDYLVEDAELLRELYQLEEVDTEPQEKNCGEESITRPVEQADPALEDQSKPSPITLRFNSETSNRAPMDSTQLTSYILPDATSIADSTEDIDRRAISLLDLLELSEEEQSLADEYDAHYLSNGDESDKSDELVDEENPIASFLSPCKSTELGPEDEISSDEDEDDEIMPPTPAHSKTLVEPKVSLVAKPDYSFDSFHPLMIGVIRTEYDEAPLKDYEWELMMEVKKVGDRAWSWEPSPLRACWSVVRY